MCGIAGIVLNDRNAEVDPEILGRMTRALSHRGPDASGVWRGEGVGLVHTRLSIIDVAGGRQPLENEDATARIVFNGEIYNHRILRERLELGGHHFKTSSDTESILHLYENEGPMCVESLRGMFGFGIWDSNARQLVLARDRLGKKPLYYANFSGGLAFGSELKSLLATGLFTRELDPEAINHYLTMQYVPAPLSIVKGIRKLMPGHVMCWQNGRITENRRYWDLSYCEKERISEGKAAEVVLEKLDEAVKIRLESEVPLGCLLSGGVDSSAVVALMRKHLSGSLRTFSIGFDEDSHNELKYARRISKLFETDHVEIVVRPDATAVMERLVWHLDEPMGDPSVLPTWYVAATAREHLTVALNGDGGDESFAGYGRYKGRKLLNRYQRVPKAVRKHLVPVSVKAGETMMPDAAWHARLQDLNDLSLADSADQYCDHLTIFRDRLRRCLLTSEFARSIPDESSPRNYLRGLFESPSATDPIDRMLNCDLSGYLPGDLLVKMDRMAMAHALETRSPFLDHELVEFAARLPANLKLRDGETKYVLKRALSGLIPPDLLYRRKQGFGIPLATWLRGPLREFAHDILLSPTAVRRGILSSEEVRRLIREHDEGKVDHHHKIWTLMILEVWCRLFLDAEGH